MSLADLVRNQAVREAAPPRALYQGRRLIKAAVVRDYGMAAVTGYYDAVVRGMKSDLPRERVTFEMIQKVIPDALLKPEPKRSVGPYERIVEHYPELLRKAKQVLSVCLIIEVALFSYLLGDESDWALVVGVALFASAMLYAIFRVAISDALAIENYRVS